MNNVNKTLYIPLYGKSYVSKKGLFLDDKKAEEIWEKEGFALKGKSKSKWLAYYMGIRSAVFDEWVKMRLMEDPSAVDGMTWISLKSLPSVKNTLRTPTIIRCSKAMREGVSGWMLFPKRNTPSL